MQRVFFFCEKPYNRIVRENIRAKSRLSVVAISSIEEILIVIETTFSD